MKVLLYADPHFSKTSSIVRGMGDKYSIRLENEIKSLNFTQECATENNCDMIVCLGDLFDKSTLTAEELTALAEVKWSENIPNLFLVGNHEMYTHDLFINSVNALSNVDGLNIVSTPSSLVRDDCVLNFIPYILENNRDSFSNYIKSVEGKKTIVFSHNDLMGLQMGAFKSKVGFDIDEITSSCDLYINGHLHNGCWVNDKILNLGNLTGQNFSEDANIYKHRVAILDTNTLGITFIENPYAFNFIKLDVTDVSEVKVPFTNCVVSVTTSEDCAQDVKDVLAKNNNIVAYKVTVKYKTREVDTEDVQIETKSHIEQFIEYVKENIGTSDIILEELNHVCGENV